MSFGGGFPTSPIIVPGASQIPYTPSVPSDWSPAPSNVGAALDQGAARIKALEAVAPTVSETAGSALAIGMSLQRSGGGRMIAENASFQALRDAFAGFAVSAAAANGDPVQVAGNGARATGLVGIVVGSGYYVSAGVLIPEADLATFIGLAASETWYRFVGTGDSTKSIKQAWGEPQQVP